MLSEISQIENDIVLCRDLSKSLGFIVHILISSPSDSRFYKELTI